MKKTTGKNLPFKKLATALSFAASAATLAIAPNAQAVENLEVAPWLAAPVAVNRPSCP